MGSELDGPGVTPNPPLFLKKKAQGVTKPTNWALLPLEELFIPKIIEKKLQKNIALYFSYCFEVVNRFGVTQFYGTVNK
jgi:hypothetical protein